MSLIERLKQESELKFNKLLNYLIYLIEQTDKTQTYNE